MNNTQQTQTGYLAPEKQGTVAKREASRLEGNAPRETAIETWIKTGERIRVKISRLYAQTDDYVARNQSPIATTNSRNVYHDGYGTSPNRALTALCKLTGLPVHAFEVLP